MRVNVLEAFHVGVVHAVDDVGLVGTGLALEDGEALRHALVADRLHHIIGFVAQLPVGVAEIIEGRAVVVGQVFFTVAGGDEAVLIDGQVAAVFGAVHLGRSAVQGRVGFIGADGFALPLACRRADEARPPGVAAVPEAGNGVKPAVAVQLQIQRHVVEGIGVGLVAFKGQLHRPPGLGGQGLLRLAVKQRRGACLACRVAGLGMVDAGFIGKGDELQQPPQQIAEGAAQPFKADRRCGGFIRRPGRGRRSKGHGRGQQQHGGQQQRRLAFQFHHRISSIRSRRSDSFSGTAVACFNVSPLIRLSRI